MPLLSRVCLLAVVAGCAHSDLPDPVALREPTPPDITDTPTPRDRFVSVDGADAAQGSADAPWRTVEHGLAQLAPGDRLVVRSGDWPGFTMAASGTASAWVGVAGEPDTRVTGPIVLGAGVHNVFVEGLDIGGFSGDDVSGLRIHGAAHHVVFRDNTIHDVTGESAMGITVYGTDGDGIRDLLIAGNTVRDCTPAPSEAITVNGNVQRFRIEDNHVHDVDNIGIDVIGGEDWLATARPSDGAIVGNRVQRANSSYEDGAAAGIYVDGADTILIERNRVEESDFGIEVGAENPGIYSQGVIVRSNATWRNYKGGLIFGGYAKGRGRVVDLLVTHNTFALDGRPGEDSPQGKEGAANGAIIVQWADRVTLTGNVLVGGVGTEDLVGEWGGDGEVGFAGNLYHRGTAYEPDEAAVVADPSLVDPQAGDLHLGPTSPAIDAGGDVEHLGTLDLDGDPRANGPVDLGADERVD